MIPRKRHTGRKIALAALIILLVGIGLLATVKRETLKYFFNPSEITVNEPSYVADAVRKGDYADLEIDGSPGGDMTLDYFIPDRSVRIHSSFSEGRVTELSGEVYPANLTINSVTSALELAESLLLPYFSKPEIEALELGLVSTIVQKAMDQYIDISVSMGSYTVVAQGDAVGGTIKFHIDMGGD